MSEWDTGENERDTVENKWDAVEKEVRKHLILDDRLSAFYGPALQEQPLPSSSWQRLRSHLGPQRSPGRRPRLRWHRRWLGRRYASHIPAFIENAFSRITYEARLPYTPSMLACSFKSQVGVPTVRVFPLGRHNIRLTLPLERARSIEPAELDLLLATGLARYRCMRRPGYTTRSLLLSSALPLVCITLVLLWINGLPHFVFPIAIILGALVCLLALWLLHLQGRKMAFQADFLVVQWLGRGRACQGLHALADRSRSPSHRRWGELSLTERIGRICGTGVRVENERLTLVR